MFESLKKMFSGGGSGAPAPGADPVEYNGYTIQPTPVKAAAGWQVRAVITREIDGEVVSHEFVRADAFTDMTATIDTTILKAKRTIDEQGERLFKPR